MKSGVLQTARQCELRGIYDLRWKLTQIFNTAENRASAEAQWRGLTLAAFVHRAVERAIERGE